MFPIAMLNEAHVAWAIRASDLPTRVSCMIFCGSPPRPSAKDRLASLEKFYIFIDNPKLDLFWSNIFCQKCFNTDYMHLLEKMDTITSNLGLLMKTIKFLQVSQAVFARGHFLSETIKNSSSCFFQQLTS